MEAGTKVICNGYNGTVLRVLPYAPSMVEVRLYRAGRVDDCVSAIKDLQVQEDLYFRKLGPTSYVLYNGRQGLWETTTAKEMREYCRSRGFIATERRVEIVVIR